MAIIHFGCGTMIIAAKDLLQHIHAHSFACQEFSVGRFADPSQTNDVLFLVTTLIQESPQFEIADHRAAPPVCIPESFTQHKRPVKITPSIAPAAAEGLEKD